MGDVHEDTDHSIIVYRDFIDEMAGDASFEGSNWHASLLWNLASRCKLQQLSCYSLWLMCVVDGELPLPFLEGARDSTTLPRWLRQICVATLRFALYLRLRDAQDLDKAHDLLLHAQVPMSQQPEEAPTPFETAVHNSLATTPEPSTGFCS